MANTNNTPLVHSFFSNNNLKLLWTLISKEYKLHDNTNTNTNNSNVTKTLQIYTNGIREMYDTNILMFKTKKIKNETLMDLNKLFLSQINAAINDVFPDIREYLKKNKIKIVDEASLFDHNKESAPVLYQDIQTKRQNEFNQLVKEQQQNLAIALNKPSPPQNIDLSDKTQTEDRDPNTIAKQYAQTIAERNYDPVPTYNKNNINTNKNIKNYSHKNISINENYNKIYETQIFDNAEIDDPVLEKNVFLPETKLINMLQTILEKINIMDSKINNMVTQLNEEKTVI